jgi:hypothetical protein
MIVDVDIYDPDLVSDVQRSLVDFFREEAS